MTTKKVGPLWEKQQQQRKLSLRHESSLQPSAQSFNMRTARTSNIIEECQDGVADVIDELSVAIQKHLIE
ncbi:hypothetical protein BGZ65_001249, partial [Modicella reniformis]